MDYITEKEKQALVNEITNLKSKVDSLNAKQEKLEKHKYLNTFATLIIAFATSLSIIISINASNDEIESTINSNFKTIKSTIYAEMLNRQQGFNESKLFYYIAEKTEIKNKKHQTYNFYTEISDTYSNNINNNHKTIRLIEQSVRRYFYYFDNDHKNKINATIKSHREKATLAKSAFDEYKSIITSQMDIYDNQLSTVESDINTLFQDNRNIANNTKFWD